MCDTRRPHGYRPHLAVATRRPSRSRTTSSFRNARGCGRHEALAAAPEDAYHCVRLGSGLLPDEESSPTDVVNLGYVVNIVEDPEDRMVVLAAAWQFARKLLIV